MLLKRTRLSWRLELAIHWRNAWERLGPALLTIISLACGIWVLISPELKQVVDAFPPLEAVLTQMGATYGTILALVVTLSAIPVQKAGDAWTASVVQHYKRDRITQFTFVWLGLSCLACFLFSISGLGGVPKSAVFAISIVALGFSIDLLRAYHSHMADLLTPSSMLERIYGHASKQISKMARVISEIADSSPSTTTGQVDQYELLRIREAQLHNAMPQLARSVCASLNDLAEVARKAIPRKEFRLVEAASSRMADLVVEYVSSRRLNLIQVTSDGSSALAHEYDVKEVTNPAYDALFKIAASAAASNEEEAAVSIADAFKKVSVGVAALSAPAFPAGRAPLAYSPLHYLNECANLAIRHNLGELEFQCARRLRDVANQVSVQTDDADVRSQTRNGLSNIAAHFFVTSQRTLAEEVHGYLYENLARFGSPGVDFELLSYQLRRTLEITRSLAKIAISCEEAAGKLQMLQPLEAAYSLTSPYSMAYLFEAQLKNVLDIDPERQWLNPHRRAIETVELVRAHLTFVVKENDLSAGMLLWNINQAIEQMMKVSYQAVVEAKFDKDVYVQEFVSKTQELLFVYSWAFSSMRKANYNWARECTSSLLFVGLKFYQAGYPTVLGAAMQNVRSIIGSFGDKEPSHYSYDVGDLYASVWLAKQAIGSANLNLTTEFDTVLGSKPKTFSDDDWTAVKDAIELRRTQSKEKLDDEYATDSHFDKLTVLVRTLRAAN